MRRAWSVALVAAVLLAGCAPTYENPDDRSHARGAELAEAMKQVEPLPSNLRVSANYDSIRITMYLEQKSAPEIRDIVEQTFEIVGDSRIASLPIRLQLSHDQSGPGRASTPFEWWGYDPERVERYFTAIDVWLSVLEDPGLELDEEFTARSAYVSATILVHDDRDLEEYRAQVVAILEDAGYVDPYIVVELAD